jgi:hypothetical protein
LGRKFDSQLHRLRCQIALIHRPRTLRRPHRWIGLQGTRALSDSELRGDKVLILRTVTLSDFVKDLVGDGKGMVEELVGWLGQSVVRQVPIGTVESKSDKPLMQFGRKPVAEALKRRLAEQHTRDKPMSSAQADASLGPPPCCVTCDICSRVTRTDCQDALPLQQLRVLVLRNP